MTDRGEKTLHPISQARDMGLGQSHATLKRFLFSDRENLLRYSPAFCPGALASLPSGDDKTHPPDPLSLAAIPSRVEPHG